MTPESQRIAIAEACPEIFHIEPSYGFCRLANIGENAGQVIPCDPLNDLNAMHESLKSQDRRFNFLFAEQLDKMSTLRGCYVHELIAKDWADCFVSVLQSQRKKE